ncbi:2-amino-4-hydroxy-6-hydroxymethyldihydropteridine diphosphokinase [Salinicoccus halodurans]|uniref:2-amino-4-hydroxy-6-hydroxymethyldihydropteridine diphosphokinase n=1 Tax=Salinicoccus halodurans TaxID=407035 RepID=A0A0F7D502_9STAP|nr:2-amino-4-hydroxy-6-hydroxymethyldihydropteridine diphosphokinase [Salinicoccus halodurans]AKG75130.1 2-amino-4-hydroxy-6-hydroxymethyldihydropteridine pyrophosphokinase [Salinicoccus halodurans]SFK66225.1 2-amino-4-hydroxy-6-hydroxymethyldihydropteridinediphosphokinase [Salinicoccus halodurans]
MAVAYLGLGSNLGNRRENLDSAVRRLDEQNEISVTNRSSLYETEPYGKTDQPDFINMCLEIETRISPLELLENVLSIEHELGRVRTEVWGPRTIDIDILLYEDLELSLDDLSIPHSEMHKRAFVLDPLSEIAGGRVHPELNKTIQTLKEELEAGEKNV